MSPEEYESFLVRCWRDQPDDNQSAGKQPKRAQGGCWHGEIEHIQTGVRWRFDTLAELLGFLQQAAVAPDAASVPDVDK